MLGHTVAFNMTGETTITLLIYFFFIINIVIYLVRVVDLMMCL